jgi:hypothetical protein
MIWPDENRGTRTLLPRCSFVNRHYLCRGDVVDQGEGVVAE